MGELKETYLKKIESCENPEAKVANCVDNDVEFDSVIDISSKRLDLSVAKVADDSARGLYIYKNSFNLIPRWLGDLGRLKTLKFFSNEVNLFPDEMRNLVELEKLQVKVSSTKLSGLCLDNMKDLKELELCKVPTRPSVFPLLSEIAGLKSLIKLSVCHFSIRYLPPEIGFLKSLEYLDLSFNKMRSLPTEITYLSSLISLKVANNKLMELPWEFSSLQRLEFLDLSSNRLSSLESLELSSMPKLRTLNAQEAYQAEVASTAENGTPLNETEAYFKAAGGRKKGGVYGVGDRMNIYYGSSSGSSMRSECASGRSLMGEMEQL